MQSYKFFDIHTHKSGFQNDVLAITSVRYGVEILSPDCEYYSVGVHPYDAKTLFESDFAIDLSDPKLVAIGEVGLDLRPSIFTNEQRKVFERQLQIANQANLPVIIHCVRAYEEVLRTLKRNNIEKAIFHGFESGAKNAHKIIGAGYSISFGVKLLTDNGLQGLFKVIYAEYSDRFFLETDDSEVEIEQVYKCASRICGVELTELCYKIDENVRGYFGKI